MMQQKKLNHHTISGFIKKIHKLTQLDYVLFADF